VTLLPSLSFLVLVLVLSLHSAIHPQIKVGIKCVFFFFTGGPKGRYEGVCGEEKTEIPPQMNAVGRLASWHIKPSKTPQHTMISSVRLSAR
jgi:hypothetical protein